MPNTLPDALIFDLDGTLADTMPVHFEIWQAILEPLGLDFPEPRFYQCGGMPTQKIVEMLCQEQGMEIDPHAVAAQKSAAFFEHVGSIKPIEPIVAIAREYHGKIPMAIATGGGRKAAEATARQIGVHHLFEGLVTADDVTHHKPHPETFLRAAELLGVTADNCRAYEDTQTGIAAARAAGMEVVDVREVLR